MPALNGQFGASGGVGSSEREQVTSSFALVQAFVIPPPVAKPLGRCVQVLLQNSRLKKSRRFESFCDFENL